MSVDLSNISAKKLAAKHLGLPPSLLVVLRIGGWAQGIDSPAFLNGIANTPDFADYDSVLPSLVGRFLVTVAVKSGDDLGADINVDLELSRIESMIANEAPGYFELD